jgi:DNA primase
VVVALFAGSQHWEQLPASVRDTLLTLPDWHGEALRWLERQLTEHGTLPWAALRADMPDTDSTGWPPRVRALIDDAVVPPEHDDEALQTALQQVAKALQGRQSEGVLQSVMRRPNRP